MQQQLQQLKNQVDEQQIVTDRMLRNAMKWTVHQIRWRTCYVEYISAGICLLCLPFMIEVYSLPATIVFIVILIGALAVTIAMHRMLPSMDDDLIHTTQKLIKFKRTKALYWKISPWIAGFLIGVVYWGFMKAHATASRAYIISFGIGLLVGGVIAMLISLRSHNKVMKKTDELLAQIEDLQKE